jgi:hypothetical protein
MSQELRTEATRLFSGRSWMSKQCGRSANYYLLTCNLEQQFPRKIRYIYIPEQDERALRLNKNMPWGESWLWPY